jgi:hypothetical protein
MGDQVSGAPKGTILELFFVSLSQAPHNLIPHLN